ncbi:carotenoid 9,10(9',10')-cleavage dioxygenase 1-like isoform X2 [Apium graveolens]|uniref:carotenoid 9,10(9',10')-cleavage dioxygenase 1-like isoform X2 n=1 Tax=Apium graveolens TaxID=4045 RepID=UPI003D7B974A
MHCPIYLYMFMYIHEGHLRERMAICSAKFRTKLSAEKPSGTFDRIMTTMISSFKPFPLLNKFQHNPMRIDVHKIWKNSSMKILDAIVDTMFKFEDQPYLENQGNFAPVEEIGDKILLNDVQGAFPCEFPEGTYVRIGPNPLFGGLKSAISGLGRSSHIWVEGEGMIHAIYFEKDNSDAICRIYYNNKHVQTETFKMESGKNKPCFIPTVEGDSAAVLSAYLLNMLRFGKVNKIISNTNVFEHSGRYYSIAESDMPQEIDLQTLDTLGEWDIGGTWNRPFTSHPKKAPGTGDLVFMGFDAVKPFLKLGIISADGMKLVHKVDVNYRRSSLTHDIGVTERYNVLLDFPLTVDINRLIRGGSLIRYNDQEYARIGVMPRYGDAESVQWFDVQPCSAFHIVNCFEDGNEVVMWACRALGSVIPGPDLGLNKFEYFSNGFKKLERNVDGEISQGLLFSRCYEWRMNLITGDVKEKSLTGTEYSMDFPMINENFTGIRNKFAYAQVVNTEASSASGMGKYGGLAKLYFEEKDEELLKIEYHAFPENTFCSGAAFVSRIKDCEEDDGWIVTYVHNEDTNVSQVYIIDAKKFSEKPVAVITIPSRVPYGFHGSFMRKGTA